MCTKVVCLFVPRSFQSMLQHTVICIYKDAMHVIYISIGERRKRQHLVHLSNNFYGHKAYA